MIKYIFLSSFVLFALSACANEEPSYDALAEEMVGEYTSVVLIKSNAPINKIPNKKYHLFKSSSTKGTHDSIKSKQKKLLSSQDGENAIASVHLLEDKKNRECVIVYKEGVDASVIKHETGHCFTPIKSKSKFFSKDYMSKNYDEYLNELFADIAASAVSYMLNKDFSYIDQRELNIKNKSAGAVQYKLGARSFDGLKSIITQIDVAGRTHEDLVSVVLLELSKNYPPYSEDQYNKSVEEYKKELQRTSR